MARLLVDALEAGRGPPPEAVERAREALERGDVVTLRQREDGTWAVDVQGEGDP